MDFTEPGSEGGSSSVDEYLGVDSRTPGSTSSPGDLGSAGGSSSAGSCISLTTLRTSSDSVGGSLLDLGAQAENAVGQSAFLTRGYRDVSLTDVTISTPSVGMVTCRGTRLSPGRRAIQLRLPWISLATTTYVQITLRRSDPSMDIAVMGVYLIP